MSEGSQKPVWFLLVASIFLAVSAGCLLADNTPDTNLESQEEGEITTVSLSLENIPEGSDWVLARLHLAEPSNVSGSLHTRIEHPSNLEDPGGTQNPGTPCFVGQVGFSTAILPTPILEVGGKASVEGREAGLSSAWPFGESSQHQASLHNTTEPEGPVPILLGLDDPREWGDRLELELEVSAEQIQELEIVDHGEMWCATGPEEFQEGTYAEANSGWISPTRAKNLASSYSIENRGVGFAFLQANLEYSVQVLEDGEIVWSEQGEPRGAFVTIMEQVDVTGDAVEIRVPTLSTTDQLAVGYLILDLPFWAAEHFLEGDLIFA